MKAIFNICNIYTFLWCVYYLQGATTTEGSLLGRLSLLGVLAISVYYFYLCLTKLKLPRYFKALNILFLMLSIYGIYRLIPGTEVVMGTHIIAKYDYLKNILISIIPIYTYYYFAAMGYIDKKWLMKWSIFFFVVAIYSFYGYQLKRYSISMSISDVGDFGITNNTAYLFVYILPILFFFRERPYLQYPLFFLTSIFVIWGMKRGAIIVLVMCLLFYILKSRSRMSTQKKFLSIIIAIIFIAVLISEFSSFYNQNEYLQYRTEETLSGDSSDRDELYTKLFTYFLDQSNILNILFGNGANSTIMIAGKNAHNDWLEILINQGIFGFFVFLNYWRVFFLTCKKAYRKGKPDEIGLALIAIFIICFMKTLFSMSINDMNIFITSALGFCLYKFEETNKSNKIAVSHESYMS